MCARGNQQPQSEVVVNEGMMQRAGHEGKSRKGNTEFQNPISLLLSCRFGIAFLDHQNLTGQ